MWKQSFWTLAAGVAGAAMLLSGCTAGAVSQADLEQQIKTQLTELIKQEPDNVECPGGLDARVGATQRCVLTEAGTKIGVTATVTTVDGGRVNFNIKVDDKPMN